MEHAVKNRNWKALRESRLSSDASARVDARVKTELDALSLRELRQDLDMTQQQVADRADMTQSELSRLEGRADLRLSTLRRYVEALGGELEISVVVGKRKLKLTDLG
jgi:DNA-binding Xre family transcriptional regulator